MTTGALDGLDLVFFTAGPALFGAQAAQVARIGRAGEYESGEAASFAEVMCAPPGAGEAGERAVLEVRGPGGGVHPLLVDSMEGIERVPLGALRPLPPLLERHAAKRGVWAVAQRRGRFALLVDFSRLMDGGGFVETGHCKGMRI